MRTGCSQAANDQQAQARQTGRQADRQQQQQGECSATTPKTLECRFSQILYAEKLAECAKTQNRNRNSPRTRNRTQNREP